jgi:hypothetical protein
MFLTNGVTALNKRSSRNEAGRQFVFALMKFWIERRKLFVSFPLTYVTDVVTWTQRAQARAFLETILKRSACGPRGRGSSLRSRAIRASTPPA